MNIKQRAAFFSVISNTVVVLLKIFVGLAVNSISVISEGIHSALDLVSALIAYITLGKSAQPADRTHPYGHGKFENISGLVEASLIAVAGVFIIWESTDRVLHPARLQFVPYGIVVMLISALINFVVFRHNIKVAHEEDSIALEANAFHLSADIYTSLGVLAGLVLIAVTGIKILDPLAAILVAVFILKTAVELTGKALRDLMDRGLPEEEEKIIRGILQEHYNQFVGFHKLRTRKAGADRYIDLHLVLSKSMDLQEAHDVSTHLENDIKIRFPHSQTIIHIEPCETACQECRKNCAYRFPSKSESKNSNYLCPGSQGG